MGTHFKALNWAVLMAPSKILENLLPFRVSHPPCEIDAFIVFTSTAAALHGTGKAEKKIKITRKGLEVLE